jgi:5-methylcytosine-specific restriction protein A
MPSMALRPCLEPRCPVLVTSGRCDAHGGPRKSWQRSPYAQGVERLRGPANQKRRKALFMREPLCRECAKAGRVTLATIRDHIVPLSEGGTETIDNEQPLCKPCSDAKTAKESARGVRRAW